MDFWRARARIEHLTDRQARRAWPQAHDLGYGPERIRGLLLADIDRLEARYAAEGALPCPVFDRDASRSFRLRECGALSLMCEAVDAAGDRMADADVAPGDDELVGV